MGLIYNSVLQEKHPFFKYNYALVVNKIFSLNR